MKIERGEGTSIHVSRDSGIVNVDTKSITTRRSLNFTLQDAAIEKDNLMYRELGKTALSATAFVGAGLQGLSQFVEGFNNANLEQMGRGAEVALLASFLIPLTRHFYGEAMTARREKREVNKIKKSS